MARTNKRRAYDPTLRREAAKATRQSILDSARRLFLDIGYVGTTMAAIARTAGVAQDTVYATVGRKAALFRLLVEISISGRDEAVPATQRDYVRAIRAEPDAANKLQIYATALRAIQPRLGPMFRVLQAAAPLDPNLKVLWEEISQRRADNMLLLANELAATGQLRAGLSVSAVADIIWSMNSPEFYLLLVDQRGWSDEAFEHWLADAWQRLLLDV